MLNRYQARAFVLLPISFNFAVMLSPLMAGQLADLPGRFPERFGHDTFLKKYPFAPPALLNGSILLVSFLSAFFVLEETLGPCRGRYDPGIAISRKIRSLFRSSDVLYSQVASDFAGQEEMEPMVGPESPGIPAKRLETPEKVNFLPFRRMFTRNLAWTLLSYTILETHTTAYNSLWPSFLSDPVASVEERRKWRLPFFFSGGAGMSTDKIGWTLAILGAIGLPAQLVLFPRIQQSLGNIRTLRVFLLGFPLVHALVPYVAVVPSSTPPPDGKTGPHVWALIVLVQTILMLCAVFVMPTQVMLVNNASPHPSARARTHTMSVLTTSICRSAAAAGYGYLYSYGSTHNLTGLACWTAMVVAILGCFVSLLLREGSGHEIWLERDTED